MVRALTRRLLATLASLAGLAAAADASRTVLALQPFSTSTTVSLQARGGATGSATLVNLAPAAGAWYVLSLDAGDGRPPAQYHLETTARATPLRLAADASGGLTLASGRQSCRLPRGGEPGSLEAAARTGLPFAPLCDGWLSLRNAVPGHRTSLERVTDFLRDRVWGGEQVIGFVKKRLYADAFVERGAAASGAAAPVAPTGHGPAPAETAPGSGDRALQAPTLGLELEARGAGLLPGRWYAVRDVRDVYVSAIAPEHLAPRFRSERQRTVNALDAVESGALVYLVAFDLAALDLHFVLGTDHPRLDWSPRPPESVRDARLPGPDGIAASAPLVRTGMIAPADLTRTVATFTGGFKRSHGAFRHGLLAMRNHGSHYGFVEQGVVFSTLQPGLATALVMDDGSVDLRTWTADDGARLPRLRDARQNGVPLVERDAATGAGVPGEWVNRWGEGNWSGSADEDLRTLRAGLCLQEGPRGRYLVYGWFSAATPSAMSRVFQGYGCRYAMHLDMNALEHTYLALYATQGEQRAVEHLVGGMAEVDRSVRGGLVPRFLGFPDDRDFFYLTRRPAP